MKFTILETASIRCSFERQANEQPNFPYSELSEQAATADADKLTKSLVGEESWRAFRNAIYQSGGFRKAEKKSIEGAGRSSRRRAAMLAELDCHMETCATCAARQPYDKRTGTIFWDNRMRGMSPCGTSFKRPQPTSR
jgi:hypothetical protein